MTHDTVFKNCWSLKVHTPKNSKAPNNFAISFLKAAQQLHCLNACGALLVAKSSIKSYQFIHTHTHTHIPLTALFPGLPELASTRNVKPIWILLKQETVSGSGISWAICKSASRSRQITMPVPRHSSFLQAGCPSCRPNNSVKALKEFYQFIQLSRNMPCIKVWHVASDEVCMKTGPKT